MKIIVIVLFLIFIGAAFFPHLYFVRQEKIAEELMFLENDGSWKVKEYTITLGKNIRKESFRRWNEAYPNETAFCLEYEHSFNNITVTGIEDAKIYSQHEHSVSFSCVGDYIAAHTHPTDAYCMPSKIDLTYNTDEIEMIVCKNEIIFFGK